MFKKFVLSLIFCLCCFVPRGAQAAELAALEMRVGELSQAVHELKLLVESQQREIVALKSTREIPPAAYPVSAPSSRQLQGRWNPDIGVVADTVLTLDSPKEDEEGADRLSVRELELVFGSAVDPYSRFDATLAISDFEEMGLEEAYLTHFGLPWDIKARVGRFKPKVGKAIPIHRDSLETVDEPLVIQRYFGLEGYNKTGADVSKILDFPWAVVHEMSFGVLEGGNGEDGALFGETRRRPTIYSHLKNYVDITDSTGLEVGLSHLAGSRDEDANFEVQVLGADGTLIHHLNANQSLKLQSEAFLVNRQESFIEVEAEDGGPTDQDIDGNVFGTYFLADFRITLQWAAGFRYDYAELIDNPLENPDKAEVGYTGYLTFYQSEFARWRVQFTHVDLPVDDDDNRVLVQGTFAIGEHKHKLQ